MTSAPLFRSIRAKLIQLVLLAVLPALLIFFYAGLEQRRRDIDAATADVMLLAHSMAEVQREFAASTRRLLLTLANTPAIRALDAEAARSLLGNVMEENPEYIGIALTDVQGRVVASNRLPTGMNLADRKYFRDILATRVFTAGEYMLARGGAKEPSFPFACPVFDENKRLIGVLVVVVGLERLTTFSDVSHLPDRSFLAVSDHQGIRLFYYPPNPVKNPLGQPIMAENFAQARNAAGPGFFTSHGSDGVRRIFAFEPIRLADAAPYMYVWAAVPEDRVLQPANRTLIGNLLAMLLVAVLALLIARLVGRQALIEPINRLVRATEELTRGNLTVRSDLTDGAEELVGLARSFDNMAAALAAGQRLLREREEHLQEAQRIAHIGSWEWDAASDIAICSREMCRLLEIDAVTPLVPLAELDRCFAPEETLRYRAAMTEAMRSGEPYEIELERRRADGTTSWLQARGEVRRDESGAVNGLRGTALDITERRLAEQEQERLQAQLNQARQIEAIGRLAGGVAHDFNNMLAVILGHIEMALDKLSPTDPMRDDLQMVFAAARRSAELTKQLLAFARKQMVVPRVLDLNVTVAAMLTMLRRLIGENVTLSWQPGPHLWPVRIDPAQIDQLLANLCINGRDAIGGKIGNIAISTENVSIDQHFCERYPDAEPGDYVAISVTDDGCGMDNATLANIFEPFFTTKEFGQGNGLGLATTYGVIRQNNGFITVESEVDRGTTFRIYLPRCGDQAHEAVPAAGDVPGGLGETILFVEDEPAVMEFGKRLLAHLGYRVLAAGSPTEAISLAEKHRDAIDLLITDVVMPEMNGRELVERVQAVVPRIQYVFMSGYPADVIGDRGPDGQDGNFLQKPFSRQELARCVRQALAR
ncbi:MAG: ATP-binding protein [Thermodesulfobacteriota bacterium]